MASWKIKICLKKNTPSTKILRYFRFESRNNKALKDYSIVFQSLLQTGDASYFYYSIL